MIDDVQNVSITSNNIIGGNEKAFAFDNKSTGAKVRGNILGCTSASRSAWTTPRTRLPGSADRGLP